MKMKKLLSGFVATAIAVSSLSLSAFAVNYGPDPVDVTASISEPKAAYDATEEITVDVAVDELPTAPDYAGTKFKGFDMYDYQLSYDGDVVEYVSSSEDIDVVADANSLYVLSTNFDLIPRDTDGKLGSLTFKVKEGVSVEEVIKFEVTDFSGGQFGAANPGHEEALEWDLFTYELGESTPAEATVDTKAPVLSVDKQEYREGETVEGSVSDANLASLQYKLMNGEGEYTDVTVLDGRFSIEGLAVGEYNIVATDVLGHSSSETVDVIAAPAVPLEMQPSVDKAKYKIGDVIDLSVLYNKDALEYESATGYQFDIEYDAEKLEFVGVKEEYASDNLLATAIEEESIVRVVYFDVLGDEAIATNDLGVFQFRAKEGVEDDAQVLTISNAIVSQSVGVDISADSSFPTVAFMVDNVAPTVSGVEEGQEFQIGDEITVGAADTYLDYFTVDGARVDEATTTLTPARGEHTVVAYDQAGNETVVNFTVAGLGELTITPEIVVDTTGYPSVIPVKYTANVLEAAGDIGLAAYQFDVTYDPTVYSYVNFTAADEAVAVNEKEPGHLVVVYFNPSLDTENSLKADDLLTINFMQPLDGANANGDLAIHTSGAMAASIVNGGMEVLDVAEVADVSSVGVKVESSPAIIKAGEDTTVTVSVSADEYKECYLSGYEFNLYYDTAKLSVSAPEGAAYDVVETETGAKVLYFGDLAVAEPIDTAIELKVTAIGEGQGLVVEDIDVWNCVLTYENGLNYAIPPVVVSKGSIGVQYSQDPDGVNYKEVLDEDGTTAAPAISFPLWTTEEEARELLAAIDPNFTFTDVYATGKTVMVGGQEIYLIVKGDADGDGELTVADLVAAREYILRGAEENAVPQCLQDASDVTDSGTCDVIDLVYMRDKILN